MKSFSLLYTVLTKSTYCENVIIQGIVIDIKYYTVEMIDQEKAIELY